MPMNEIQVGRYNAYLHKLMSMKEGAPSPLLAPEVFPTLQLESERPEWLWLGGVQMGMSRAAHGVEADWSYGGLNNPPGSGVIGTVDYIHSTIASNLHQLTLSGSTSAGTAGAQLDTRAGTFPTTIGTTLDILDGHAAARPGELLSFMYLIQGVNYPLPIVLTPGSTLWVSAEIVARAVSVVFQWRERVFEPSESR